MTEGSLIFEKQIIVKDSDALNLSLLPLKRKNNCLRPESQDTLKQQRIKTKR